MNQSPSKMKVAMNFGALLGVVMLVFVVLNYAFSLYEQKWFGFVETVVFIAGLVIGTKKYRDENCGGFISYGSALGYGTLLSFFVGVVSCVGTYMYLSFIDSSFTDFALEQAELTMYESGQPDEAIEIGMAFTRGLYSPGGLAFVSIFSRLIMGFVVSLIAAAFIKKEGSPFE